MNRGREEPRVPNDCPVDRPSGVHADDLHEELHHSHGDPRSGPWRPQEEDADAALWSDDARAKEGAPHHEAREDEDEVNENVHVRGVPPASFPSHTYRQKSGHRLRGAGSG